ncbi:hypothetical protein Pmani_039521 [Petrolisthes manimaculis]|uniref:Uncharacterized protein n=1 Tax=Petrolisthes manimaculis TaxID=1843537 RepID=A0AAE1TL96_9EUCA|nr:hypothetical protein Pmani_039521 [Petrolisthes manimaculis]
MRAVEVVRGGMAARLPDHGGGAPGLPRQPRGPPTIGSRYFNYRTSLCVGHVRLVVAAGGARRGGRLPPPWSNRAAGAESGVERTVGPAHVEAPPIGGGAR